MLCLEQKFVKTLMYIIKYKFCAPRAFKWLSTPRKFTLRACAEFYCEQIAEKFSQKFPPCIMIPERLIQTSLLLLLLMLFVCLFVCLFLRVFVQPAKSAPARLN